jgi:hypothetical protein
MNAAKKKVTQCKIDNPEHRSRTAFWTIQKSALTGDAIWAMHGKVSYTKL